MPRQTFALPVALSALAVTALALATAGSAVGATAPSARPGPGSLGLSPIGTYASGAFDEGAAEIVDYDPRRERAFVANADAGRVDVLDLSDPTAPTLVDSFATPGVNSVAVDRRLVAVAQEAEQTADRGTVAIFRAGSLRQVNEVRVGVLPDMVTFTPNGRTLVVANEGEPEGYCDRQVDPRGSVSVIDVRAGGTKTRVRTAGFTRWDGRKDELRADGVRIFGPGASASQDLEPEYVAVARNGRRASVSLQENNALATVDLRRARVSDITGLGTKDHSVAGSGLDASDKEDRIRIRPWPVNGQPMPDAIAAFTGRGQDYLVTANEGGGRE